MDALGNVTTYQCDLAGNQTTMTDALGRFHTNVYSSNSNRLSAVVNAMGQRTTHTSDLKALIESGGDITTSTYAGDGLRRTKQFRQSGATKKTTYIWDGTYYLGEQAT